jgi:hypothetical protein
MKEWDFILFRMGFPTLPKVNQNTIKVGATSAGRPTFTSPHTSGPALAQATSVAPKVTARQLQARGATQERGLLHTKAPSITEHAPLNSPLTQKLKTEKTPRTEVKVSDEALLRRRAFAYLLDTVIHAGFWLATNLAAVFVFKFQLDSEIVKENLGQFLVFFLISQWLFVALQEVLFENSIGKVFFNLEFKRNHRSLFARSIVFFVGALCFGLGLYYRPQDRLGQIQLKSKIYA